MISILASLFFGTHCIQYGDSGDSGDEGNDKLTCVRSDESDKSS